MHAFEMDPHGVHGIHKSAVRERVGNQQMSKFVLHARLGRGDPG
jgi:hypothetical protein